MVWKKKYPKTPRYNEPLHNEVYGITNDSLYSSNSKLYEKEPRYNETSLQLTNFVSPLAVPYREVPPYKAHTRNITWPPSTPFHNLYLDCVTGVERSGGWRKPSARPRPTNFFARLAFQAPLAKANNVFRYWVWLQCTLLLVEKVARQSQSELSNLKPKNISALACKELFRHL